jgi:hypothetical protein
VNPNVREAQQRFSRSASRERRIPPLGNVWTRIRHPRSHRTTSTPLVVEVATAQAQRVGSVYLFSICISENSQRTIVSRPRRTTTAQSSSGARANPRSQLPSTQEGSAQASSDIRNNDQGATASPLRHEATAQNDSAQSSEQARRLRHTQGHMNREGRVSIDSLLVYAERDTESVRAHGCWNIFWDWLCYKGEFLHIWSGRSQFICCISVLILLVSCLTMLYEWHALCYNVNPVVL